MCSLCFRGKNGFVDFIKADVLTCLCGSCKERQEDARALLAVRLRTKAVEGPAKRNSGISLTILKEITIWGTAAPCWSCWVLVAPFPLRTLPRGDRSSPSPHPTTHSPFLLQSRRGGPQTPLSASVGIF